MANVRVGVAIASTGLTTPIANSSRGKNDGGVSQIVSLKCNML